MKIFLSWSGPRSKATAEALGDWISRVIQAVEPWISAEIDKGARWQSEIADRLEEAKVGIICLTATNLSEPWILFESGALSKTKGSYVCTFLLDNTPADIEPPLSQFQHTVFTKEDVLRLVETINRLVGTNEERALTEKNLLAVFEKFWPDLDMQLQEIRKSKEAEIVRRQDRELLEEILEILRAQEKRTQETRALNTAMAMRERARQKESELIAQQKAVLMYQELLEQLRRAQQEVQGESDQRKADEDKDTE